MRRLLAIAIDVMPALVVVLVLTPRSDSATGNGATDISLEMLYALLITAPILIVFEASTGRTPSKFLLGIKVVGLDGNVPTLKAAAIRNAARVFDTGITFCFLGPIVLWDIFVRRSLPGWLSGAYRYVWSEKSQRWGDELAGTYVIKGPWNPVRVGSSTPPSLIQGSSSQVRSSVPQANSGIRLRRRTPR